MLFALAFLPMFGIGGLTGLPLGLAASDITLHDTYYVVAHFHYLVAPGTVFALFAGIYHWFPQITGRVLDERLGKIHFWGSFVCMNNDLHADVLVGLAGVNRRLYDAGAQFAMAQPYQGLQRHMTVAAIALGLAQIPFLIALATARRASPIEAGQTRIAAVPAPRRTSPPGSRRLANDVLRIVALGLRAVAGGQCRLAGARQRLGARARWLGAAGRGGGRGAADTGGALASAASGAVLLVWLSTLHDAVFKAGRTPVSHLEFASWFTITGVLLTVDRRCGAAVSESRFFIQAGDYPRGQSRASLGIVWGCCH